MQQIPLLPYMVAVESGDCDKHLYEFQLCCHSNSYKRKNHFKKGVYIWGERGQEGSLSHAVPEIYGSKQTEYKGVGRGLDLFTDSHKSLATCAITIVYPTGFVVVVTTSVHVQVFTVASMLFTHWTLLCIAA